jgi:uncharacterized protein (TIGR02646 family)
MRKFERKEAPECLRKNAKEYGKTWKKLHKNGKKFNWYEYQNQQNEVVILENLYPLTQNHCSFCDKNKVIKGIVEPNIEHFYPKAKYHLLAYRWNNLFLCCGSCNHYKGNQFSRKLLKPDRNNYDFDKYFMFDFETGEIKPNESQSVHTQARAAETIKLYGLNKDSRPQARLNELENYIIMPFPTLVDFSYRDFIERAI